MLHSLRVLLCTLLAIFLLSGLARGDKPSAQLPQDVAQRVKNATAYFDGKHGHGSGFVVLPNVVATNSHVIREEGLEDIVIRFVNSTCPRP